MASNTTKGFPYPQASDPADVPSDIFDLATAVDAAPGISSLSQTQIDALSVAQKWAGRVVWNTTTSKHQRSTGSAWVNLGNATFVQTTEPTMTTGDSWLDTNASA